MIIYSSSKDGFSVDVESGRIEHKIHSLMQLKAKQSVGQSEVASWRNSLQFMNTVLRDLEIPETAGIAIEYQLPGNSKRVDFIISGSDANHRESVVIVELKQWSSAKATTKASVVETAFKGGPQEVLHPSYQAWSYAQILNDFNETVEAENIQLLPCAFLHNYEEDGIIDGDFYKEDLERAPLFLKTDTVKLREFIKKWVKHGDAKDVLYRIDNGKIRPSKSLANNLASLMEGNREFTLIDEQKIVYETALNLAKRAMDKKKQVLIVHGGPGTGKTVVAINLLVELIKRGKNSQYVTKNAAPRAVYEAKLTGHMKRSQISNLFVGSGSFTETDKNTFDALIVDEAHRLNEFSGLFKNLGENQIKELIHSSRFTVFFLDEAQRVTLHDIGSRDEILKWAGKLGAEVSEYELASQFRCGGSDGYIAWLDNTLQIKQTANPTLEGIGYDFQVFDDPSKMLKHIKALDSQQSKSRIVAGYCWDWASKKDPDAKDISFPASKFAMKWNLASDGPLWIMQDTSVNEAGCIHTCQGLEMDYVGVIIGPDLIVRDGKLITNPLARSGMDSSIKGIKKLIKASPELAATVADQIIKNTYRTLMTRGMRGCFVYSPDKETREYFSSFIISELTPVAALKVASPKSSYES